MPVIQRQAVDDFEALQVASAFDKHGIRVVAIVPPTPQSRLWLIFGQGEAFDCDEVDETIGRIMNKDEEL